MSRSGSGYRFRLRSSSSSTSKSEGPTTPTSPPPPLPSSPQAHNESTSSFSSQETIKAAKQVTKSAFKELLGGGGNNKNVAKPAKGERVYVSGRGGARKGPKSPALSGPTNAEKLEALLAGASDNDHRRPRDADETIPDSAPGSSFFSGSSSSGSSPSRVGTSFSARSKATIKTAVREVLGGGGNDHGLWRMEGQIVHNFGRGGAYKPPSSASSSRSTIEILSEANTSNSSLSIARNSKGLFFFGHGRSSSPEEGSISADVSRPFFFIGSGEGFSHRPGQMYPGIHDFGPNFAMTRSSLNKSGMSKISIKVAVKEVLGGGGNDDGEWKFVDFFYPSFGRGGEGTRGLKALDDIFNGRFQRRIRANSQSTVSFPSVSSDSSSVYASSVYSEYSSISSVLDQDPEEGLWRSRSTSSVDVSRFSHLAHHDLAIPHTPYTSDFAPHKRLSAHFIDPGRSHPLADDIASRELHSDDLINFRNQLMADKRERMRKQEIERNGGLPPRIRNPSTGTLTSGFSTIRSRTSFEAPAIPPPPRLPPPPLPTLPRRLPSLPVMPPPSLSPKSAAPSSPPPGPPPSSPLPPAPKTSPVIPTTTEMFAQAQAMHTFTAANHLPPTDYALAYSLALVQARSEAIKTMQEKEAVEAKASQLADEREQLKQEREILAKRVRALKREVERREKTIEGLAWLVGNMPEHLGKEVIIDDGEEMDEEMMKLMREAEEELIDGDSRTILGLEPAMETLEEEPALPESPVGVSF